MEIKLLRVTGMTCAACVRAVEKAALRVPGVREAQVNFATQGLRLAFDPQTTHLAEIQKAVSNAGYSADIPPPPADEQKTQRLQHRTLLTKLLISASATIPLLYLSMGSMLGLPLPDFISPHSAPVLWGLTQLALVLPVFWAGRHFFTGGFSKLARLEPNMDSLVALGTSAAFLTSVTTLASAIGTPSHLVHDFYFEAAAVIITLILTGQFLELLAKGRASAAVKKLLSLTPATARILKDEAEIQIPQGDLTQGDAMIVRPGEKFAADGTITSGRSTVDESLVTGESLPINKAPGASVLAGTVNLDGLLKVRAEKVGEQTLLAQIIHLVEQAQLSKAPIARLADKIAGIFVPAVLAFALLAGAFWFLAGQSPAFALAITTAVLIVACPCALGLATPMAIMVASGRGAELGILFKNATAIESAKAISVVVFDKTGTLTQGKPCVTDLLALAPYTQEDLLRWAASAEYGSEHPLAKAVLELATQRGLTFTPAEEVQARPGQGLRAITGKTTLHIGTATFFNESLLAPLSADSELHSQAAAWSAQGKTLLYLSADGLAVGILAASDPLRPESKESIRQLRARGIKVALLTGDHQATADSVADQLQITQVFAQVLPQQKADVIKKLQAQGHRVAMVGDGINDAPALAVADLGMAAASGTDIAAEAADIVLMHRPPMDAVIALQLGEATLRNIKQNLFWAFGYNLLALPIAAGLLFALGGPLLSPMIAGGAMAFSSVTVVFNALRLRRFQPKQGVYHETDHNN